MDISRVLSKYVSPPIIIAIFEFVKYGSDVVNCRVYFLLMIVGFGAAYEVVEFGILFVSQVVPDYDAVDFAFVHFTVFSFSFIILNSYILHTSIQRIK